MKITVLIFLALLFCNKDKEINTNQNQSNKVESQTEVSVKKEIIKEKKEFDFGQYWWGITQNRDTVALFFDFEKHHTF